MASPHVWGNKIAKKLQDERDKALQLLEKSQSPHETRGGISHLFRPSANLDSLEGSNSRKFNLSVSISDLVGEETEDLDTQVQNMTFNPSEFTGRSTLVTKGATKKVSNHEKFEDILATSRFQHVRDLNKSYRESCGSDMGKNMEDYLRMSGRKSKNGDNFDEICATSICKNVRDLSKSYRDSLTGALERSTKELLRSSDRESFHSDDFVSSDNMKQKLFSDDERDWENEFCAIPGRKKTATEVPIDSEGFSGIFFPHNASHATDQFSLGALCNKKNETITNMITAESPQHVARCLLNSTQSSVVSATSVASSGRTYTAGYGRTDVDSLIDKLNLSESTNEILANLLKKDRKEKIPLEDITKHEVNAAQECERISGSSVRSGKENRHKDREYEEFCRFKSKSPRRVGSILLTEMSNQDEEEKSKGTRKRSRSSVYGAPEAVPAAAVVEYRRAKSPNNRQEMRALSGVAQSPESSHTLESTITSDRMFLFPTTPMDSGKVSLPNYGLAKRDNRSPGNSGLTRTTSQLSTASEFSHREGYLPLKATHSELSWGSVRLRTSVTKNFQIKNMSPKRLTFRAVIDGPGFQFGSADGPQMTITLQPQECRGLWIAFCPTIKGSAVGQIIFKPPMADNVSRVIPLYGYGGHATVTVEGLQQGPVGCKFLPIGDIKFPMRCFEGCIRVHNKGSLAAFVSVNVENTRSDQRYFSTSVTVSQSRVILQPACSSTITIKFTPQRDELKKLLKMQRGSDVMVIANLIIITGDEPTRQRMKKLIKTMPNHALTQSPVLSGMWNTFPNEDVVGEELKEHATAMADLSQGFKSIEVALTLNNEKTDETVMETSGWMADFEETVLFRTIIQGEGADHLEVTHDEIELISVEPREITWKCQEGETKRLVVKSLSEKSQLVKIDTNHPHLLEILPSRRELLPHESLMVLLRFFPGPQPKTSFNISFHVEQHVITIPIQVQPQHYSKKS